MTSYSGKFNGQFSDSFLSTRKVKIKLFWVIMHSVIGLYIKEFNHDNAKKGAICCVCSVCSALKSLQERFSFTDYIDVTGAYTDHAHTETAKENK